MKARIKLLLDDSSPNKWSRIVSLVIQLLIVISLIAFSIETLPDLSDSTKYWLQIIEIICVVIFTVEYHGIIENNWYDKFEKKTVYCVNDDSYNPVGTTDNYSRVSPRRMLVTTVADQLKLHTQQESKVIGVAIKDRGAVLPAGHSANAAYWFVTFILIYLSAFGIYYFENDAQPEHFSSIFSSLWWAIVTLTTVGYGDIYPITVGGRVFTFFILLIGLGIVAIPTGIISSALTKTINDK